MGTLRSLFRRRRLLIVAFAVSLLVHLLVATRVRWPFVPAPERVDTIRVQRIKTIRVTRMPTPVPYTPPPNTPSPQPSVAPTILAKVPVTHARGNGATSVVPVVGSGPARVAAGPTPHPSPTSTCSGADTPAAMASQPPYPDIPAAVRGSATSGVARVKVSLDAAGAVQSATVAESTGNSSLDLVAVLLARDAGYTPATHLCKPVAGDVEIAIRFQPW